MPGNRRRRDPAPPPEGPPPPPDRGGRRRQPGDRPGDPPIARRGAPPVSPRPPTDSRRPVVVPDPAEAPAAPAPPPAPPPSAPRNPPPPSSDHRPPSRRERRRPPPDGLPPPPADGGRPPSGRPPGGRGRGPGDVRRWQTGALGLRGAPPTENRFTDGGGRFGAAAHDPILGWYEPDAQTLELPIAEELARLRAAGPPAATIPPPPVLTPTEVRPEAEPLAPPEPAPPPARPAEKPAAAPSSERASILVAAGILLSRSAGLLREIAISRYLGTTAAADAFKAALRIPNTLQNLLGEGVLSASFIPVYAKMRAEGQDREAGELAGAICGLLLALTGVLSFVGVVFTEPITRLLVTGFAGDDRFDLTVRLVRIMFPAMGLMPISAWCLGVLNSHRKFFLSYVAPVLWNAGQILALVSVALVGATQVDLAVALAWGVLIGSIGQVAVQLPSVLRVLGRLRLSLNTRRAGVRNVLSRFGPVVMGRGVVQILGYVDLWLASFLAVGAVSALTYAQVLYLLPISIFGMSVAAAELPDLSSVEVHDPETRRTFRLRLADGMARILFYVAPTTTLFIVVGDVIVRVLFQRGSIGPDDTLAIWYVIAIFSLGLPATTASRLLQNALYALGDARTPARLAAVRVVLAALIGLAFMFPLDRLTVVGGTVQGWGDILAFGPLDQAARTQTGGVPHLGIVGLSIGAAVTSWVEYRLLSTALAWRIGRSYLGGRWLNSIAFACAVMAVLATVLAWLFNDLYPLIGAPLVLGPPALVYVALTRQLGVPEGTVLSNRLLGLVRR